MPVFSCLLQEDLRPMRRPLLFSTALAGLLLLAAPAVAEITVVAAIKPVHALTAAVMQGIGEEGRGTPHLIVQGGASPHSMSLKPSDARALQEAAVVVWVGEGLEAFLVQPLETLAGGAAVVELAEAPGLTRLPYREGGAWEEHSEHEEESHAAEEHEHDHEGIDMHLWLDPQNAKAMVAAIAAALTAADPDNAALYQANAEGTALKLDALTQEIAADLAPVKDVPFVVFHDAFQYLDTAFGLNNVGSITVNPEQPPGAARLAEIHATIAATGARCVFAEPQFEPRLVQVVIEGTAAKTATLDPLGAAIPDGPDLYFTLMRENAAALKACLGEAS
jgi:zinc transport system substrate-binding protein